MRLDHLLSKEEEVGVVLLFSCQEATALRMTERKSGAFLDRFEQSENMFLVAMRLGDTPVLIPNTMVKT